MAAALTLEAVARCGERLLGEVLGDGFDRELFLAGGAFRTLLTGVSPRDLDLWAPDEDTRAALGEWLRGRGATVERDHPPFQTTYRCGAHLVDLPCSVGTPRLVDRLERFDLGLSAVGVTWRRGRVSEALVDPCATRSVEARSVFVLRPLRNPSYLLNTIERARRYARELDFDLPSEEERFLWESFAAMPRARREKVIGNYSWAGGADDRLVAAAHALSDAMAAQDSTP